MRASHFLPLTLLLVAAVTAKPDPFCGTGIRNRQACCPLDCAICGGPDCGILSERLRTDCCPTSILTGARLCDTKSPPCKLSPVKQRRGKCGRAYKARVFKKSGLSPRRLRKTVRRFKKLLRRRGGVRVIDWEGDAPFALPKGYYNESGVLFSSRGDYHAVSNAVDTLDDRFSSYLPEMVVSGFQAYSGERLFTPVMDNKLTVKFVKLGERALVNGFGAVFVDVGTATLKVFDGDGCLIRKVSVPKRKKGLSFAGVFAKGVGTVELELGNVSVSVFARKFWKSAVGDVVVLDDFVFGKPY